MIAAEFAKYFNPEPTDLPQFNGELAELMGPARDWSIFFGRLLYDRLTADPRKKLHVPIGTFQRYDAWVKDGIRPLSRYLAHASNSSQVKQARTEVNFHALNTVMFPWMWQPVQNPKKYGNRWVQAHIPAMQDRLAIMGLKDFLARESGRRQIGQAYYEKRYANVRTWYELRGNITDFGIGLFEAISNVHATTFVPAPIQFSYVPGEGFGSNKSLAYVALRRDGKAAGMRLTSLTSQVPRIYPIQEGIATVHGGSDLGNELMVMVADDSTDVKPWAYVLSAQRASELRKGDHDRRIALAEMGVDFDCRGCYPSSEELQSGAKLVGSLEPRFDKVANVALRCLVDNLAPVSSAQQPAGNVIRLFDRQILG